MTGFAGRHALIVGGSSGMGRGAARAFAARGGDVTVTTRSADRLDAAIAAVADGLEPAGGSTSVGAVHGVVADLGDPDTLSAAVAIPERLDHLVVTAAPGRGVTDREFFDGKFWGTQTAAAAAAERLPDDGTMLFASGGLAVRPTAGQWSVSASFAAVEALARALAVEHAPMRVNCIRPGLFATATWASMPDDERERFFAERSGVLPAGRPASGEDFGDAFVGILAMRYLTGQVVVLDGGQALLDG